MLKSLLWGGIGLGIFLVLTALAVWFYWSWQLEGRTLRQQEEQLMQKAQQAGLLWQGIERFEPTLHTWQQGKEQELEEKRRNAEWQEREVGKELASLETAEQALKSQLKQVSEQLKQAQERRDALKKGLQAVKSAIQQISERCGLPERDDLEQKVKEREELERKQADAEASLRTLTGRQDADGWRNWFEQTSLKLLEELREDAAALPNLNELKEELRRLRQERERKQQERNRVNQEVEQLRREVEQLRARLHPLGVVNAVQVFLGIDEAREKLKQRIKQRLAALLAIRALENLQQSYVSALEETLEQASSIFEGVTQRYRGLRYDRSGGSSGRLRRMGGNLRKSNLAAAPGRSFSSPFGWRCFRSYWETSLVS